MSRLTFDDLTPDDMPAPYVDDSGDRADAFRDSLGDLVRCGGQTTGVVVKPNYLARAAMLYARLNADRMNYTRLSHRGQRAERLLPRLAARMGWPL